ncbi:hypothetical protein KSAC_13050 [Komagataeibacter saccharivorans]|uniref:hypothetical protein n=1 Tax=Komagataeibacter saccharivorans TaxID=265959 RepID=UPI0010C4A4A9|nr:hypothetical protein [Komagataeibacter saccharivorans]QBL93537.1 hypothetical protein KSAC_13050 [Komagataeibacter saccharivorans]
MKNIGRIAATGLLVLTGLAAAAPGAQAHGRGGGGDALVGGLVGGIVGGVIGGAMVDSYGRRRLRPRSITVPAAGGGLLCPTTPAAGRGLWSLWRTGTSLLTC